MRHERYKITLFPGQCLEDVEKLIPQLKAGLWANEVTVSGFGRTVYLDVYKGQLPRSIPYRLPEQDTRGLTVPIGVGMDGELITVNMASDSHCYILVGGYQGMGKSVLGNGIIRALLEYPVEWVRLILIDLKMGVEHAQWASDPHVWLTATDPESFELKNVLTMLNTEVRRRYDDFKRYEVRDIHEYRAKVGAMHYLVLMIDEFAELSSTEEGERLQGLVKRTLQIGRAAGLRCCVFTQRPTVTNITGDIKALFPDRVALRCATSLESRIIIDKDGAEALEDIPGRGIFLSAAKYRKVQVMNYTT